MRDMRARWRLMPASKSKRVTFRKKDDVMSTMFAIAIYAAGECQGSRSRQERLKVQCEQDWEAPIQTIE